MTYPVFHRPKKGRKPKGYDGTALTSRGLNDVLPEVLSHISKQQEDRPDLVLAAWKEVIGEKLAPQTEAVSFKEGVLTVHVKNSTLYSLLCRHDKGKVVEALRRKFPSVVIKDIYFRIG